jgi:hypothetical protein
MSKGTVLMIIVLVVLPVAAILFAGAFGLLEQLGRGGLAIDEAPPPSPPPETAAGRMEREMEIRQLVGARRDRQLARGEQPIDVEEEVRRLLDVDVAPAADRADAALRDEVRQLVIARNERRMARGEPALDVEAEIDRQLKSI